MGPPLNSGGDPALLRHVALLIGQLQWGRR